MSLAPTLSDVMTRAADDGVRWNRVEIQVVANGWIVMPAHFPHGTTAIESRLVYVFTDRWTMEVFLRTKTEPMGGEVNGIPGPS